jgi:carbamoylphosphate synthase small subunit
MITRNSGKPLTSMEQAEVVKRLMAFNWSIGDVVKKTGFSRTHINNLLSLSAAPAAVTDLVKQGKVSARQAVKTIRQEGGKAAEVLTQAVKTAGEAGKRRATGKHIEVTGTVKVEEPVTVSLSDRLRQIEIQIAEIRQLTVEFGVGVNSIYCELLGGGVQVLSASRRLREVGL